MQKEQQKMKNAAGIAFGSTARMAMECSFVMSENYMYTNLGVVPIMRQLRNESGCCTHHVTASEKESESA